MNFSNFLFGLVGGSKFGFNLFSFSRLSWVIFSEMICWIVFSCRKVGMVIVKFGMKEMVCIFVMSAFSMLMLMGIVFFFFRIIEGFFTLFLDFSVVRIIRSWGIFFFILFLVERIRIFFRIKFRAVLVLGVGSFSRVSLRMVSIIFCWFMYEFR